jgi:hypothetical protein
MAAPVPAPAKKKARLVVKDAPSAADFRWGEPFVFDGKSGVDIHRPGPEHFKLTRLSDGKVIRLALDYDKKKVEEKKNQRNQKVMKELRDGATLHEYNQLFKGTRVYLFQGTLGGKQYASHLDAPDLYACATLKAGERYRLTWATWPVGATRAVEVSCDFQLK